MTATEIGLRLSAFYASSCTWLGDVDSCTIHVEFILEVVARFEIWIISWRVQYALSIDDVPVN